MTESVASQSTDQFPESGRRVARTDGRTDGDELVTERERVRVSSARGIAESHCSTCERILRRVDTAGGPDSCWEWQGHRNWGGYGLTHVDGKTVSVHRTVYMHLSGEQLSRDVHLLHQCDNPACCNPRHLRPGDHLQNMADRKTRGAGYPKGEDNHKSIRHLSDADIADIRATYKWHSKGRGAPALGARYGVSRSVIEDIVNYAGRWADAS